jgi:hypothetical protein
MTLNRGNEGRPASIAARLSSSVQGGRPIRNTGILLGLLLSVFMAQAPRAEAANSQEGAPPEFNAAACYRLVQDAGRQIAWARWEQRFPVDKIRSAVLRDGTPSWATDLVKYWITDAYEWEPSDQQIQQWAAELGSVDHLPSAEQLSVHEAIAIWMRRLGRQCGERAVHVDASANLLRNERSTQ